MLAPKPKDFVHSQLTGALRAAIWQLSQCCDSKHLGVQRTKFQGHRCLSRQRSVFQHELTVMRFEFHECTARHGSCHRRRDRHAQPSLTPRVQVSFWQLLVRRELVRLHLALEVCACQSDKNRRHECTARREPSSLQCHLPNTLKDSGNQPLRKL